jgi:phospholipid transport system substrate-binding protein
MATLPIGPGRKQVNLRLTRSCSTQSRWIAGVGFIVLLSLASPKLALSETPETPETARLATESSPPAAGSGAPSKVVDTLHENLISVMKDSKTLGYDGRFAQLEPVISTLFDIPFMAEKSVGRYWKTVDEENRSRLLAKFGQFTVANYAGRFTDYSGQSFETLKEEASKHGTVMVYSQLDTGRGETIQLNYRLRPDGNDGWRIIDVLLNGTVSELALRRSEYSSLIQREGFAALMAALNDRIDDLAGGKVTDQAS